MTRFSTICLSLAVVAAATLAVVSTLPPVEAPGVRVTVEREADPEAALREIRRMRDDAAQLRKELEAFDETLRQYERGTLKSA